MKKKIIALIVLILAGAGLLAGLIYFVYQANIDDEPAKIKKLISGEVVFIDHELVPAEGPFAILVSDRNKKISRIEVPSFELHLCPAVAFITDPTILKPGDVIEAQGYQDISKTVTVCESSDHYLKIVRENATKTEPLTVDTETQN